MPLQEPALRAVGLDLGWNVPPRLPDVRGLLTELLRDITGTEDDWFWDSGERGPSVVVWNEERRLHIFARSRGLHVLNEVPDQAQLLADTESALRGSAEILGITGVTHCLATATWIMAAKDAHEAECALEDWLFTEQLRSQLEGLGGRPDDVELEFTFGRDSDVLSTLELKTTTDEKADDEGPFMADFEKSDFPPAMVIATAHRITELENLGLDEALGRAGTHLEHAIDNGATVLATGLGI